MHHSFAVRSFAVRSGARALGRPMLLSFRFSRYAMAQDPELWDEPLRFNPDRWQDDARNHGLDLHGKQRRKDVDHYKFIPFSMGPRTCPGYSFAKVAVFLQAATIMQSFEWGLTDKAMASEHVQDGQLDLLENGGLTIMPRRYAEMGYIKAKPRPAASLARPMPGDIS